MPVLRHWAAVGKATSLPLSFSTMQAGLLARVAVSAPLRWAMGAGQATPRFQGFKHGEHIAAALGVQKIIAVGYALGDALQGLKFAEMVLGEQLAHFVVGYAGVNGHKAA